MSSNLEVDDGSAAMIVVSEEEQPALEISTAEVDNGESLYDVINSRRSPKSDSTGNKRA